MTTRRPFVVLVGCGKMGAAMLRSWISSGLKADYAVIEPGALPAEFKNIPHSKSPSADIKRADILVLAVKPQIMGDVCDSLKPHTNPKTLILSIAAGQPIKNFESAFGAGQPVVRAMPNTPAAIGKGITVAVANGNVLGAQQALAEHLLKTTGQIEWVENESLLNAITALSGSGPAYVFYLIEVLAKAGEESGLPAELSMQLARQTVIGSAALAESEPGTDAATLRANVTSPGGTTEAALKILMNGELEKLFEKAIAAATKRGEELS